MNSQKHTPHTTNNQNNTLPKHIQVTNNQLQHTQATNNQPNILLMPNLHIPQR